jgi:tRNA_anti-like
MKKNKKTLMLLVLIGVVALAVGTYAYNEYNRKAINVAEANTDFTLSSNQLVQQFANKSQYYDSIYHSRIIEVTGAVKEIDTDEKGFHTIVIGDSASSATIRCSLDSLQNTKIKGYGQLKTITIKGIYTGFNADDLGIGSDVILSRCILEKNN